LEIKPEKKPSRLRLRERVMLKRISKKWEGRVQITTGTNG